MRRPRFNPDAMEYKQIPPMKKGKYPPYIIWDPTGPIFRAANIPPNKVVGNDGRGTILMQGLEYPSKRFMKWQTTITPAGFTRGPYPYTY